ncbi:hypothetical protein BDA99DRAFT_537343 [Phascolomyces articulosus]|uniref:Uncharacterized protein n=1 Tax=Phascolomyces articulosus TaxID=60185 RepID=A0AAD5PEB5_9FUNG|nr:hypothetical protein BDA99DRAFT_537343 [Phascolomyces articulosus]
MMINVIFDIRFDVLVFTCTVYGVGLYVATVIYFICTEHDVTIMSVELRVGKKVSGTFRNIGVLLTRFDPPCEVILYYQCILNNGFVSENKNDKGVNITWIGIMSDSS